MSLSIEKIENIKKELDNTCAQLREILDYNLDIEHENLEKNTERLPKQLQDEFFKSEYFDPSSFLGSMKDLQKKMLKAIGCRKYIENSDTILDLFTSSILLAQQLTNSGYNKDIKRKLTEEIEQYCIYLNLVDAKVEWLWKLTCGHLFHLRCINQWFEDQEAHKNLICPPCKEVEVFANVRDTYSLRDVENINYNNNLWV